MVSPSGKLHARRPRAKATVCGVKYERPSLVRRGSAGWVAINSPFQAYSALADGRTCRPCEEGLQLGTGPGA